MATKRHRVYLHVRTFSYFANSWGAWGPIFDTFVNATNTVSKGTGVYPDWRERIKRCVDATTSLSGIETDVDSDQVGFAHTERYQATNPANKVSVEHVGNFSFTGESIPDADSFVVQSVENQAITDCVNKIRQANTSLKGLVVAGELGETVRMVNGAGKQVFRGLHDYLDDVNHLVRTASPRRLLSAVGRRWLEYSFGWKPLINDIDDGIKAIRRINQQRPPRVLIRVARSSSVKKQPTKSSRSLDGYRVDVTSSYSNIYSIRLYGAVSVSSPSERVPHEFGFKLDEFVPTVWELIPYSFLADYFLNIGAIIDAYSLNTSTVRWLNKGTMSEVLFETQANASPVLAPGWIYTSNIMRLGKPFRYSRKVKSRSRYSPAWLIPSLEFSIPGSSTKWLNISALASQHTGSSAGMRRSLRI